METLWRTYHTSIFNPASVKVHEMQAEITEEILTRSFCARRAAGGNDDEKSAEKRYSADREWQPAPVPEISSLTKLRQAASTCTACPLYKNATQTVFGEGRERASLMFLGEQPGDQEDLSGKPFVGPAGQLLNRAP